MIAAAALTWSFWSAPQTAIDAAPVQGSAFGMREMPAANPLFQLLRAEFARSNPRIVRVNVIDVRAFDRGFVVLAWGHREDEDFSGDFNDWLYGLFVVNRTLTRVERTLELMPIARWNDYILTIETMTPDRVTLAGAGGAYGDAPFRRSYDIGDSADAATRAALERVLRLPPTAFATLPAIVQRQLETEGCVVPQDSRRRGPHNVVFGHFAAPDQLDVAVLCSMEGQPTVRMFWGGYALCREPIVNWIAGDSGMLDHTGRWSVVLESMSPAAVADAARDMNVSLRLPIHDGLAEKYCQDGIWIDLHPIP